MLPSVHSRATDHVPVAADEVRQLLDVQPGETVIDAIRRRRARGAARTRAQGQGKYVAVDRDPSVRPYFESFRRQAGVSTRFLRGDFADVFERLADNSLRADAILFDLGVSAMPGSSRRRFCRLGRAARHADESLGEHSARDLVNGASERRARPTSSAATARSATPSRSPGQSSAAGKSSPSSR